VKWGTNSANFFLKIAQGIRPWVHLCSTFWSNLSKNFSLGVLHPCRCT